MVLTPAVFNFLSQIANSPTSEHRLLERSRIVLAAAAGVSDAESARRLSVDVQRISRWRRHWLDTSTLASSIDEGARVQVLVNGTDRIVLPVGIDARPVFAGMFEVPFAFSEAVSLSAESRVVHDPNQARFALDSQTGTLRSVFDSPLRLSFHVKLQARW